MKVKEVFVPDNFTFKHGHFTVECHDGMVDILINPDPATGSENGLIGAVRTREDLMDRIEEITTELFSIRNDVEYSQYHSGSCWLSLPEREAKPADETEVA